MIRVKLFGSELYLEETINSYIKGLDIINICYSAIYDGRKTMHYALVTYKDGGEEDE